MLVTSHSPNDMSILIFCPIYIKLLCIDRATLVTQISKQNLMHFLRAHVSTTIWTNLAVHINMLEISMSQHNLLLKVLELAETGKPDKVSLSETNHLNSGSEQMLNGIAFHIPGKQR
jgi:hypothetical protein